MYKITLLLACVCAAAAQRGGAPQENYGPPIPYAFQYLSQLEDGSHSHEQNGDGSGKVTGKYTLTHPDGTSRTVTYYADESGFHADIVTSEVGTESKDPADVTIQSSAVPGPEAAVQNEGARRG